MRLTLFASACLLCLGVAHASTPPATPVTRLDHILLWGHGIDQLTSTMAVKLGFQVRPGRDPGGVANRYIRFSDTSFIELLGVTRPDPTFDPGMKEDQQALKGGPGARTFGFRSSSIDTIRESLQALHYAVTPFFSGPDSAKPGWRLFAFDRAPLSSNTFFIDYKADYAPDQFDPTNADDYRVTREHPNGARVLSSIWLVSGDADADRRQLEKMGFGHAVPVTLPSVGAKGFCVPVGPTALLALQPVGQGLAQQTMTNGGPRVLGVSYGVADLGRAQRWVERGYERKLSTYPGLSGES
ncbi:MAG TPA: VOC family protein, partial [Luteibacter sp.]|nr:VOC family protein [Luteibacter sp.]